MIDQEDDEPPTLPIPIPLPEVPGADISAQLNMNVDPNDPGIDGFEVDIRIPLAPKPEPEVKLVMAPELRVNGEIIGRVIDWYATPRPPGDILIIDHMPEPVEYALMGDLSLSFTRIESFGPDFFTNIFNLSAAEIYSRSCNLVASAQACWPNRYLGRKKRQRKKNAKKLFQTLKGTG